MPTAYADTKSDAITKRQRYETLRSTLWTERASFDAHWQEIARNVFPVRPRFMTTDRNRGDRRTQGIIDATATFASNTLASGLHAGLTSPARPWMKLSTPDPALAKVPAVKQWLYELTGRMHVVFQLSNLYNALPVLYRDMANFGTAAMGILDDPGTLGVPGDLLRCYPYPIGSFALGMDNRGLVTTFVREYLKTACQLVEEFGGPNGMPLEKGQTPDWTRFSPSVKTLYEKNPEGTVEVCWIVTPNKNRDPNGLGYQAMPWTSCHFEKGRNEVGEQTLRESGYWEFPIVAPRWFANAEDTYGTDCPGMTALGHIKALQIMQKRKAQAIEKMINPPLQAPTQMRTQAVSLIAGGITYADEREGQRGIRPVHEIKPDLSHFQLDLQDVRVQINKAYYVDVIQMLGFSDQTRGAQPVTAREVEERHEEKLMALGPVLESTMDEVLDPLIDRAYAMMDRAGLIPEAPPELEGVELVAQYVSILAQAQKLIGVVSNDRLVVAAGQLAAASGSVDVFDKIDIDLLMDDYADRLGVDPETVRTPDAVQAVRQQRAQARQAEIQSEQALKMAQAAKAMGTTPMGGDTALNRIVQGATG